MHYFEHHIGDYDSATAHLSLLEDGAYRRLICLYYRTEAPLPSDIKTACRLVRAVSKPERDTVAAILAEFFELTPEGWRNPRCDAEIARFLDKQAKARRSAEARWSAQRPQCDRNANASDGGMQTHSEGNADGMHRAPVPNPQYPIARETGRTTRSPAAGRGSRLPKDWALPDEWRAWAEGERPDLDPNKTADRFKDFWIAKAGKDGVKLDWSATWRNWCRSEKATPSQSGTPAYGGRPFLHADDDLRNEVSG